MARHGVLLGVLPTVGQQPSRRLVGVTRRSGLSLLLEVWCLCVINTAVAQAGVNVWTTHGPPGGATALAIDPTHPGTLYVGTVGVFKSTDGAGSWTAADSGMTNAFYTVALAIDPTTPNTLYAGTDGGVFKSTDGAGSWTAANSGLTRYALHTLNALAIDPTTPSTLYAGTSGGGVFKSTNAGGTWAPNRSSGLIDTNPKVNTITIDPTTPSTLYVAFQDEGVFDIEQTDSSFTLACPQVPSSTCFNATKSSVLFKGDTDTTKQKFTWKWLKGMVQLGRTDFGDPVNGSTNYKLCVYDETGGTPVFKMGASIANGGTCGAKPCWKAVSTKGWAYKDKVGKADGITKVQLKGGKPGRPLVQAQGKGASLPMPAPVSGTEFFDQDPAVIVQLHNSSSPNCWSSTFDSSKKNDGTQFKAVSP